MATRTTTSTLPYDWYVDPAVLRVEQERIFASSWQYAMPAAKVADPGRIVAAQAGHVPVIVVRGRTGELRGFVNVCRHRGFVLCDGESARETIQCPYHAWTYDLDGTLRNAPRADREIDFERDELGLVPVAVDTWGPFVFVNPDVDAAPLADQLGELPELVAAGGVDIGALEFSFRADGEPYETNWKVVVENYLECYHCSVAHPSLAKAIDVAQDAYVLETRPTFSSQLAVARNGGGGVYDATGEVERGQFHFLFPTTVINVMPGQLNLSIGPVLPLGVDRTTRYLDYFFGPGVDEGWKREYLALDDVVGIEDRVLVARVYAGMRSGAVSHGRLLPESEQLVAHFQALVLAAVGGKD